MAIKGRDKNCSSTFPPLSHPSPPPSLWPIPPPTPSYIHSSCTQLFTHPYTHIHSHNACSHSFTSPQSFTRTYSNTQLQLLLSFIHSSLYCTHIHIPNSCFHSVTLPLSFTQPFSHSLSYFHIHSAIVTFTYHFHIHSAIFTFTQPLSHSHTITQLLLSFIRSSSSIHLSQVTSSYPALAIIHLSQVTSSYPTLAIIHSLFIGLSFSHTHIHHTQLFLSFHHPPSVISSSQLISDSSLYNT